jgi:hypothetical protein
MIMIYTSDWSYPGWVEIILNVVGCLSRDVGDMVRLKAGFSVSGVSTEY